MQSPNKYDPDGELLGAALLTRGRERGVLTYDEVGEAIADAPDLTSAIPRVMRILEDQGIGHPFGP